MYLNFLISLYIQYYHVVLSYSINVLNTPEIWIVYYQVISKFLFV